MLRFLRLGLLLSSTACTAASATVCGSIVDEWFDFQLDDGATVGGNVPLVVLGPLGASVASDDVRLWRVTPDTGRGGEEERVDVIVERADGAVRVAPIEGWSAGTWTATGGQMLITFERQEEDEASVAAARPTLDTRRVEPRIELLVDAPGADWWSLDVAYPDGRAFRGSWRGPVLSVWWTDDIPRRTGCTGQVGTCSHSPFYPGTQVRVRGHARDGTAGPWSELLTL